MTIQPVKYGPGTQRARQQTEISEAAFTDTDHMRFNQSGRLATIPPYSEAIMDAMSGKNRSIYAQRLTGSNPGDFYLFGTHSHLYVYHNSNLYNITPIASGSGTTLPTDPLEITSGDNTVVVNHTAHGYADGDRIAMSGIAGTTNGVPAADFNREHIITYISANEYSIEVATSPTSTDLTAGGAAVVIKGQITEGNPMQDSASGMGAGDFGGGLFGAGGSSATGQQLYPRIWSFAPYGNDVVMCPGDYESGDGQKIYLWDGDTDAAPSVIAGAPTDCHWVSVINNSVVALCGRTVKIAELGSTPPSFTGDLYYEKTLERVDRAICLWNYGEKSGVIFPGAGAILLRYVGGADLWDLSDIIGMTDDGIIGPMACIPMDELLLIQGRQSHYQYDGGIIRPIPNELNQEWIVQNLNSAKDWHSFAALDSKNSEAYFYNAMGSDSEPGNYALYSRASGKFTLGEMQRTAAQRPGKLNDTYYMTYSGDSETTVYRHFTKGATTFDWYAETAFFYVQDGEYRFTIGQIRPDSNQSGSITLEIITREFQQSPDISWGTWTIDSTTDVVSPKAAGRFMKLRFSGSSEATLGFWTYDYQVL